MRKFLVILLYIVGFILINFTSVLAKNLFKSAPVPIGGLILTFGTIWLGTRLRKKIISWRKDRESKDIFQSADELSVRK